MLDNAGHPEVHVSVDGGINPTTGRTVVEVGADVLVAGNAIYGASDINKAIADLHSTQSQSIAAINQQELAGEKGSY